MVELLLSKGADPNRAPRQGHFTGASPLWWAAAEGHLEMVRLLYRHGADVNTRSDLGITPLMVAAAVVWTDIVRLLLDAGADPDLHDTWPGDGVHIIKGRNIDITWPAGRQTALTAAAYAGHADVVELLIKRGADGSRRDATGKTWSDIARQRDDEALLELVARYAK